MLSAIKVGADGVPLVAARVAPPAGFLACALQVVALALARATQHALATDS